MTDRTGDPLVAAEVREMPGITALPRVNGDLVFESPWQGRALGAAIGAAAHVGIEWEAFRTRLMEAIADQPDRPYYDSWVAALERLVVDLDLVTTQEIDARAAHLAGS